MPKNRPGRIKYVTATKTTTHGNPCVEVNFCGVAVKQVPPSWSTAYSAQQTIAIGEKFAIIAKGIVEVDSAIAGLSGAVKGDTVWINNTNNALTLTDPGSGNGRKYGRVAGLAGERGGASNRLRVDLDSKDSF
jgi:hypothetical protein